MKSLRVEIESFDRCAEMGHVSWERSSRTHANFTSNALACVRGQSPNRHLEYVQHSQIVWHEKWRSICSAVFSIALCIFHVFNFRLAIQLLCYTDDKLEKKSPILLCFIAFILWVLCECCVEQSVISFFHAEIERKQINKSWATAEANRRRSNDEKRGKKRKRPTENTQKIIGVFYAFVSADFLNIRITKKKKF